MLTGIFTIGPAVAIPGTIFTALRTCGMPQGSTQCLHSSSGSRGNEPWLWALQKCWQHGLLHASSASVFKPGLLIGSWLICTPLTETYWADSSRSCFQNCLKYINIVLIDIKLKKKKSLKSSSDYSSKRALLLLAIFVKQAKYPRKGQMCIWRKYGIGIIGQKEGEERAGISSNSPWNSFMLVIEMQPETVNSSKMTLCSDM